MTVREATTGAAQADGFLLAGLARPPWPLPLAHDLLLSSHSSSEGSTSQFGRSARLSLQRGAVSWLPSSSHSAWAALARSVDHGRPDCGRPPGARATSWIASPGRAGFNVLGESGSNSGLMRADC